MTPRKCSGCGSQHFDGSVCGVQVVRLAELSEVLRHYRRTRGSVDRWLLRLNFALPIVAIWRLFNNIDDAGVWCLLVATVFTFVATWLRSRMINRIERVEMRLGAERWSSERRDPWADPNDPTGVLPGRTP